MSTDQIIELLKVFVSWPVAAIVIIFFLKDYVQKFLDRLLDSKNGELEIGTVKAKLGELVENGRNVIDDLGELQILLAETRLIELKFAERNMGHGFKPEEIEKLKSQISKLTELLNSNKSSKKDALKRASS